MIEGPGGIDGSRIHINRNYRAEKKQEDKSKDDQVQEVQKTEQFEDFFETNDTTNKDQEDKEDQKFYHQHYPTGESGEGESEKPADAGWNMIICQMDCCKQEIIDIFAKRITYKGKDIWVCSYCHEKYGS
jgi:hypothetical protein